MDNPHSKSNPQSDDFPESKQYTSGRLGGQLQTLLPTLTVEWLDDFAIQYVMFYALDRTTIDGLISNNSFVMEQRPPNLPVFAALDSARASAGLSTANALYAMKRLKEESNTIENDKSAWVAFVLNRSLTAQVLSLGLRALSGVNKKVHLQIFYNTPDALRWLRFHLNKARKDALNTPSDV